MTADHTAPATIVEAAHNAAAAVNLHVPPRTNHFCRQQDREIDHRSHGHIAIHGEQHAIC